MNAIDREALPSRGWKERLRGAAHGALAPVVRGLAAAGVRPDHVTVAGCLFAILAGLAFFEGAFRWGSLALALSGVCDMLDGELARHRGGSTRFGAFLDSTLDRFGEAIVLTGIAGFYVLHLVELVFDPALVLREYARGLEPWIWARMALVAVLALVGSFLVSYTRARAEGLGLDCKVGIAERPERVVALIVAGLFPVGRAMAIVLMVLTLACFVTAGQRVVHVYRATRERGDGRADA